MTESKDHGHKGIICIWRFFRLYCMCPNKRYWSQGVMNSLLSLQAELARDSPFFLFPARKDEQERLQNRSVKTRKKEKKIREILMKKIWHWEDFMRFTSRHGIPLTALNQSLWSYKYECVDPFKRVCVLLYVSIVLYLLYRFISWSFSSVCEEINRYEKLIWKTKIYLRSDFILNYLKKIFVTVIAVTIRID